LENLRLVSEPLATIKAATELGRIVELAREQGFPTRGLRLFQAQAFLSDSAPGEANRILSLVSADGSGPGAKSGILRPAAAGNPRLAAYEQATLVWLQVVATALISPAPAAQSALLEALAKRPNTVASLRELVLLLRKAGRTETAEAVLRRGEGPYPENPWIREQLAEVRAAAAQAAGKVESRPAEATVVGEKPFFTQLNERIGAGDWAAAQKQIRELRTAKPAPAWLSQRDADLLLAQIRIEHGLQDRLAMLIAVKLYLDGDVRRSQATLAFAQEIHAAGAKEEALLVVREVLRKTPDFPPAERLRAAWTPAKK
jgi:predicted Zn-dependent protease